MVKRDATRLHLVVRKLPQHQEVLGHRDLILDLDGIPLSLEDQQGRLLVWQ